VRQVAAQAGGPRLFLQTSAGQKMQKRGGDEDKKNEAYLKGAGGLHVASTNSTV